jgi:hypothetical protein
VTLHFCNDERTLRWTAPEIIKPHLFDCVILCIVSIHDLLFGFARERESVRIRWTLRNKPEKVSAMYLKPMDGHQSTLVGWKISPSLAVLGAWNFRRLDCHWTSIGYCTRGKVTELCIGLGRNRGQGLDSDDSTTDHGTAGIGLHTAHEILNATVVKADWIFYEIGLAR